MPTRVLVVDDSLTVRKHLVEVLCADPAIEVVAEGADGRDAIELCERLRPDVVTLDMMMPVMSGLAATEYIMAYFPTPILVVSASTARGELMRTYDALAAGAVDVVDKPTGEVWDSRWERDFVQAVKRASRIKVITHLRGRIGSAPSPRAPDAPESGGSASPVHLIAIGASTGGPSAIVEILDALPPQFPVPILLVLHIARPFADAFAEWLDGVTHLPVRWARDGEPLPTGPGVLVAPPDRHLVLAAGTLRCIDAPERHSCRPSVDVLFESLAEREGARAAGFLLTGMGVDGASGLLAMRRAGALTVAQDEVSSVVYGMPRQAALIGAAREILPLHQIGSRMAALGPQPARRGR